MLMLKGFRYGLLLQLAVGPVCLFILQASASQGFGAAEAGVAAVTLADGVYIALALRGVSLLGAAGHSRRRWLRLLGPAVLILFGADMVLGAFGRPILPAFPSWSGSVSAGTFVQALLLTAANPLTLLFWTGIFAAKTAELQLDSGGRRRFGAGCLLSTLVFLTCAALSGTLAHEIVTPAVTGGLNLVVGSFFTGYAFRMLLQGRFKTGEPTA